MRTPGPYDALAHEYYEDRHITSRNFDAATTTALTTLAVDVPSGLALDVGCGRGRIGEYLGTDPSRVVQLDNSAAMLGLPGRESCSLQVLHDAEQLPFPDRAFGTVAAFLCDPFLGLNFLSEVARVLTPGGFLIGTTPSYEWGRLLRDDLGLETMTTRFVLSDESIIETPSALYARPQLEDMLNDIGFRGGSVTVTAHKLPETISEVSPDVRRAAKAANLAEHDLDVLYLFTARKPDR